MSAAWNVPPPQTTFGRLQVRSVQDALNAPRRTYLLEGIMAPGELSVWWGPPKSGKSFLMLRIAYGIALGKGIWNRKASQIPVLYIAAEGASGVNGRIRALHDSLGDADMFHHIAQSIDLYSPRPDLNDLIAAANAYKCKLVVLDTLARVMGTGDESSTRDMGAFVRNCDKIRDETEAHVAIVHHGGWEASHSRGSIALPGAAEIVIKITGKRDEPHTAEIEHAKDDEDGAVMGFELQPFELPGGRFTCIAREADASTAMPSRGPKLPANTIVAHQALCDAVNLQGQPLPIGDGFPGISHALRGVTAEQWRAVFYDRLPGIEQDSRRKAFNRAMPVLLSLRMIGSHDGWVWTTKNAT
jgi:hypothetical protein